MEVVVRAGQESSRESCVYSDRNNGRYRHLLNGAYRNLLELDRNSEINKSRLGHGSRRPAVTDRDSNHRGLARVRGMLCGAPAAAASGILWVRRQKRERRILEF